MGRRSRKKSTRQAVKPKAEPAPDGKFALSLALAMRKSMLDDAQGNAIAQNRIERLDALTRNAGQGVRA